MRRQARGSNLNPPELVPINQLDDYADLDALQAHYRRCSRATGIPCTTAIAVGCSITLRYRDAARKVVGVGSVGQRAWTSVWIARDIDDPMMIQMKEATYSVLEHYCGASPYATHGERVVQGQSWIQNTADNAVGLVGALWPRMGRPRD